MRQLAVSTLALLLLAGCEIDGGLTKHNAEPTATIVDPLDGAAILEGTTVSLAGVVGDGDSETADLEVAWRIAGASACPEAAPDAAGNTWCDFVMTDANTDITLTVADPSGGTASDTITVLATPDQSPTVSIESPTVDGHYYSDQLITFRGTVGDVEDAPETLAVRWVSSLTGEVALGPTPTSAGVVESFGNLSEGEQALQLFVVDSNGNESSASLIVDVGPPNSAPTCTITNPLDEAAGAEGSTVNFEGLVADVDVAASWLAVTWESDKDGVLGTSTPDSDGTIAFGWSGLSAGPHAVTLRVIDDLGAECTTSIQYTIGTPPDISIESPAPGEVVNEGDSLAFTALVSDIEDPSDALSVAWESDPDGTLNTAYADSSGVAAFSESVLTRGLHTLTATVTDTSGLSARATTTFVVNGLPSAPGVSITPGAPATDDALVVSVDSPAVDPEGDPLSYLYQWTRDGVADSAGTTIGAASTTRGETWEVSVWAYDGYGDGLVGATSVVIGNTAPSLALVVVTPDPASRNDTLTCASSGFADADGDADSSTFAWTINGAASGTGSTLSGPFIVGEVVTCTATPFDGTDAGTAVSDSVTITNGAPAITSLTLSPTDVYTNDTVAASVSASDPEGDALTTTYSWTINSVAAASTGATLDGSAAGSFDRDDVVEVTLSVTDGVDTTTSTASVPIQNTPPTAPTLAFDPSLPEEAEALQCAIDVASTDDDGDTIRYSFRWLQDTSAFTALDTTDYTDDTVPAGITAGGETWTCTVVPDDGTDDGPSASSTATIGSSGGDCIASGGWSISDSDDDGLPDDCDLAILLVGGHGWTTDNIEATLTARGWSVNRVEEVSFAAVADFTPYDVVAVAYSADTSVLGAALAANAAGDVGLIFHRGGEDAFTATGLGGSTYYQSAACTVDDPAHFVTEAFGSVTLDVGYTYKTVVRSVPSTGRVLVSCTDASVVLHTTYRRLTTSYYGHSDGMPWAADGELLDLRSYAWAAGFGDL